MVHGDDDKKEPPTWLCGQAQAGHGEIEGDLVQGTDVGTLVFSSVRAVRSFDRLRVGARRGNAGEATHCGEVLHADRARGGLPVRVRTQTGRGSRGLCDGSGSPEVGAQGGLGLHVRPKGQSFLCGLPAARQTGAEHSPFRRRGGVG